MRVAIFGGGSIGARHAMNLRNSGVLTCVLDVDPTRGAAPEMFDPRWPDAVIIATPAATHEAVATTLLACGYSGPLFVEKPLALRSAAPVFRDWPHPVTMVGYNWRFHPEVAPLSALLASGGTLHLDMRTDIAKWPGAAYSDPLLECSHEVDLAYAWLGAPTSVQGGSLDGARRRVAADGAPK
jgi:predicted dehydrogenase